MRVFVPDYYNDFKCIAGNCRHSCCIGWEIDVDENAYEYYKTVGGTFGIKLHKSISNDDVPHFILDGNERCPHLNECGLCDIIINLGEKALCQICSDHPRFRNFYSQRTELGLGLCCEAVANLIVNHEKKTSLCEIENDGEDPLPEEVDFFKLRNSVFEILQNRNVSIGKRLDCLLEKFGIEFSVWDIIPCFKSLEYMGDELVTAILEIADECLPEEYDICFEQLSVYFIYRHLADGIYDGLTERMQFSVLSVKILMLLCASYYKKHGTLTRDIIADFARLYSAEIEYSEENVIKLLDAVKNA